MTLYYQGARIFHDGVMLHDHSLLVDGGKTVSIIADSDLPVGAPVRRLDGDTATVLTAREYTILHALMQRPGHILSRAELEDKTYGWGEEVESNAIDYLIHALRKKLGADSIRNVRGVGWCVAREAKTP